MPSCIADEARLEVYASIVVEFINLGSSARTVLDCSESSACRSSSDGSGNPKPYEPETSRYCYSGTECFDIGHYLLVSGS